MKTSYQPCVFLTAVEIAAGEGNSLAGVRIIEIDANGASTGAVYESGAAGIAPTLIVSSTGTTGGGGGLKTWQANTAVDAGEVRRVTIAVGNLGVGDFIASNSGRITGATFDATEAGNWTELPNDPDLIQTASHNATSVIGRNANSVGNAADIAATADNQVLIRTGGNLGFGSIPTAAVADNAIDNTKAADMAANTVKTNATAATANPSDVSIPVNTVFGRKGGNIVAEPIATAQISDNAVDNTKIADMGANTVKVNNTAATGNPTDVSIAANQVLGRNSTGNLTGLPVTDAALTILDDASVAAIRTTLDTYSKAETDARFAANDAMIFKGLQTGAGNPNYPAGNRGETYRISSAGRVGGASGKIVEIGDLLICLTDASVAGDEATVGANWTVVQSNIDGAVTGPVSSTADEVALFNGVTGKVIKSSGKQVPSGTILGTNDVVNTLLSTSATTPLSANQGKVLNENKSERTEGKKATIHHSTGVLQITPALHGNTEVHIEGAGTLTFTDTNFTGIDTFGCDIYNKSGADSVISISGFAGAFLLNGTGVSITSYTIKDESGIKITVTNNSGSLFVNIAEYQNKSLIDVKQDISTLDRESLKIAYKYGDLWRPNTIDTPGMQIWLRSDELADSGFVQSWTDQSGNARNAIQATVGQQPVIALNKLNGWSMIEFGGDTNDVLSTAALPALHGSEASIFTVLKNDSTSSDVLFSQEETSNNRRFHIHPRWNPDNNLYIDLGNINNGDRITIANSPFVGTGHHIMSVRRSGTNGEVWHDGVSIGTKSAMQAALTAFTVNQPFYIGAEDAIGTNNFEGEVAEIILFNTALSVETRQRIEGYLAWKYALQADLPVTHPYKYSPPTTTKKVTRIRVRLSGNTANTGQHIQEIDIRNGAGVRITNSDMSVVSGSNSSAAITTTSLASAFDNNNTTFWDIGATLTSSTAQLFAEAVFTLNAPQELSSIRLAVYNQALRTYHLGSVDVMYEGTGAGTASNGSDGTWVPVLSARSFYVATINNATGNDFTVNVPRSNEAIGVLPISERILTQSGTLAAANVNHDTGIDVPNIDLTRVRFNFWVQRADSLWFNIQSLADVQLYVDTSGNLTLWTNNATWASRPYKLRMEIN